MAIFAALREAVWPTVDVEQQVADFQAEVERLARERQLQNDPFERFALATEVLERQMEEMYERLAKRMKCALWILLAAIALWTAIILAFG